MNNKSFEEMVRFMGGVTVEEVYETCAIKKEEIVVDVVNEEDVVDIGFYGTSYATTGIRYTESIDSPFIKKLY